METPNAGQNLWMFVPCEIWQMTLKNNKAHILHYFKLCASFHCPETTDPGQKSG